MSELVVEALSVRAVVDVSYRLDPDLQLLVPAEMRERYEGCGTARWSKVARYTGDFAGFR